MGKICSMCGKSFDLTDEKNNFSFKGTVYEGSSYAGLVYNLNLCCGCFDKLAKYIVPQCNKEVFGINTDERDYDGESFDFIRRIRRIIPANNLEFAFRRKGYRPYHGVFSVEGIGECREKAIKIPRYHTLTININGTDYRYNIHVAEIGRRAFWGEDIHTAVLDGITVIAEEAFMDCKNLIRIYLPRTLRLIERAAFKGCDNLKEVIYGGSLEEWNNVNIVTCEKKLASKNHGFTFFDEIIPLEGNEPILGAQLYFGAGPVDYFEDCEDINNP